MFNLYPVLYVSNYVTEIFTSDVVIVKEGPRSPQGTSNIFSSITVCVNVPFSKIRKKIKLFQKQRIIYKDASPDVILFG